MEGMRDTLQGKIYTRKKKNSTALGSGPKGCRTVTLRTIPAGQGVQQNGALGKQGSGLKSAATSHSQGQHHTYPACMPKAVCRREDRLGRQL